MFINTQKLQHLADKLLLLRTPAQTIEDIETYLSIPDLKAAYEQTKPGDEYVLHTSDNGPSRETLTLQPFTDGNPEKKAGFYLRINIEDHWATPALSCAFRKAGFNHILMGGACLTSGDGEDNNAALKSGDQTLEKAKALITGESPLFQEQDIRPDIGL